MAALPVWNGCVVGDEPCMGAAFPFLVVFLSV